MLSFFFLSTVNDAGHPTVSHQGGGPGFVRVLDPTTVVFPSYDGNGMFLPCNIAGDGRIGLLFIDFSRPRALPPALTTIDVSLVSVHRHRSIYQEHLMSRVQLALNVSNIDEAVAFYSKLFNTEVNKRKPGYANFAIAEPPLKLVLIEGEGGGTLNHLGVEVETAEEVEAAEGRLSADGLATTGIDDTTCCYALKTETWVNDPDGAPWEWYVKTGDAEQLSSSLRSEDENAQCCAPAVISESVALGSGPSCS